MLIIIRILLECLETLQEGTDSRKPILVIDGLSKSYQEGEKLRVVLDQAGLAVFPADLLLFWVRVVQGRQLY